MRAVTGCVIHRFGPDCWALCPFDGSPYKRIIAICDCPGEALKVMKRYREKEESVMLCGETPPGLAIENGDAESAL